MLHDVMNLDVSGGIGVHYMGRGCCVSVLEQNTSETWTHTHTQVYLSLATLTSCIKHNKNYNTVIK